MYLYYIFTWDILRYIRHSRFPDYSATSSTRDVQNVRTSLFVRSRHISMGLLQLDMQMRERWTHTRAPTNGPACFLLALYRWQPSTIVYTVAVGSRVWYIKRKIPFGRIKRAAVALVRQRERASFSLGPLINENTLVVLNNKHVKPLEEWLSGTRGMESTGKTAATIRENGPAQCRNANSNESAEWRKKK